MFPYIVGSHKKLDRISSDALSPSTSSQYNGLVEEERSSSLGSILTDSLIDQDGIIHRYQLNLKGSLNKLASSIFGLDESCDVPLLSDEESDYGSGISDNELPECPLAEDSNISHSDESGSYQQLSTSVTRWTSLALFVLIFLLLLFLSSKCEFDHPCYQMDTFGSGFRLRYANGPPPC